MCVFPVKMRGGATNLVKVCLFCTEFSSDSNVIVKENYFQNNFREQKSLNFFYLVNFGSYYFKTPTRFFSLPYLSR